MSAEREKETYHSSQKSLLVKHCSPVLVDLDICLLITDYQLSGMCVTLPHTPAVLQVHRFPGNAKHAQAGLQLQHLYMHIEGRVPLLL